MTATPIPDLIAPLTDEQYAALLFAALCELQDELSATEHALTFVTGELRRFRRESVWAADGAS